jgi:hypothetical protein
MYFWMIFFFVNGGCLTVSIWREVSGFIKIEGR